MPSIENSLKPFAGRASLRGGGRASPPGEPFGEINIRLGEDASPHRTVRPTKGTARPTKGEGLPVRKKLPHGPPPFAVSGPVVQFVTLNAAERGGEPFLPVARALLDAARFYHGHGRWFLRLFLVMPDHLHMLATFPEGGVKATCGAWKGFLRKTAGVRFQGDCFEHRIRNEAELSGKWHYIRENPVRKGLVATAEEWPWWLAFDPVSGEQIGRASPPGVGRASPPGGGRASPPGEPNGLVGGLPGTARPTKFDDLNPIERERK